MAAVSQLGCGSSFMRHQMAVLPQGLLQLRDLFSLSMSRTKRLSHCWTQTPSQHSAIQLRIEELDPTANLAKTRWKQPPGDPPVVPLQ